MFQVIHQVWIIFQHNCGLCSKMNLSILFLKHCILTRKSDYKFSELSHRLERVVKNVGVFAIFNIHRHALFIFKESCLELKVPKLYKSLSRHYFSQSCRLWSRAIFIARFRKCDRTLRQTCWHKLYSTFTVIRIIFRWRI